MSISPNPSTGDHTLTWSNPNYIYHTVQEYTGSGWANVGGSSGTSKNLYGRPIGTLYYRLKRTETVCSGWPEPFCEDTTTYSETKSVVVQASLSLPSDITGPDDDTDGTFTLNWGSVAGATHYPLDRRLNGGSWSEIQSTSANLINESVSNDGVYDYRVKACDASDCSDWTPTKTVNVATAPSMPGDLQGPSEVHENSGDYTLTWTAATGTVTGYELQESTNGGGSWLTYSFSSSIFSKAFTNKPSNTYAYRLRACNTVGTFDACSAYTAAKTVEVDDFINVGFASPANNEDGSFKVTWAPPGSPIDTVDYLEQSISGGGWTTVYTGDAGSFSISGAENGSYRYRVRRVIDDPGTGGFTFYSYSKTTVVFFPPEPTIVTATAAGGLPYETGVTKGGNAYITVPILPAPGVNGLQPGLSLTYNSGRERQMTDESLPADTLGYGWSVNGFSTIRRCMKNVTGNITLTSSDKLCLNGEPLVVVSGTYWSPGSEYRTLRESYHKVTLQGTAADPWFEVHAPDGSVVEFGNTGDSRMHAVDYEEIGNTGEYAEIESEPYLWSINRQVDPFGNEMNFAYHEDEAAGVNHPKSIVYGYNDDTRVDFQYIDRDDERFVDLGDIELEQLLLLHSVHVIGPGSKTVRTYTLKSETSPAPDEWRRLKQIQLCGYDENGLNPQCIEPLSLDWSEPTTSLEHLTTYVDTLTDSLGAITEFEHDIVYDDGINPALFNETPFGTGVAPSDATQLGNGAPTADAVKSVVTKIRRSNGIGGWHDTEYAYQGIPFKSDKNWGFLGFYASRIKDVTSGIVTYNQYRLDYPHFADVSRTVQYDGVYPSHTELLTDVENHLDTKVISGDHQLPYTKTTTSAIIESNTVLGYTQVLSEPNMVGGFITTSKSTRSTGSGRTLVQSAGSKWGDVSEYAISSTLRSQVVDQIFDNATTAPEWLIGFATDVTVDHHPGEPTTTADQTQVAEYIREPGTNAVKTEKMFDGDPELQLYTSYGYDARGNLVSTTLTGQNIESRTFSLQTILDGRYPSIVRNPLNHDTDLEFDYRFGLAKSVEDPNSRETMVAYDEFARVSSQTTPDNTVVSTTYKRCGIDVTCAAVSKKAGGSVSPVIEIESDSSVSPKSRRFLDALGRRIRSETESFDGTLVRVDTEFDARGRVAHTTRPYLAGDTVYWVDYEYDLRSRLKKETRPDGTDTEVDYAVETGTGVRVTTTNEVLESDGTFLEDQVRFEIYNILGDLETSTDDSGSGGLQVKTAYEYWGSGLPKHVNVGPSGAALQTSFWFDDAGNRTDISGPDIGSVTSKYTALGELREQVDNLGNRLVFDYDKLGRIETRQDYDNLSVLEGTAAWTYDPTNAIGAAHTRSYGTGFTETFAYQTDSKLDTITTQLTAGGLSQKTFVRDFGYDTSGRLSTIDHPSGIEIEYGYNSYGYLESVTDTATQTDLETFVAVDAFGNVEDVSFGNSVDTARTYDPKTGRLLTIDTTKTGVAAHQDNTYQWQTNGILESRVKVDGANTYDEVFTYDGLNRLTKTELFVNSSGTASRVLDTDYDIRGNLEHKLSNISGDTNVDNYTYATGKNRLDSVDIGTVSYDLEYDANGSITRYDRIPSGDDKFLAWNARNLPEAIVVGDSLTTTTPTAKDEFEYGPGGQRYYKRTEWKDGANQRVEHTFYVGSFEELVLDPSDTQRNRMQTTRIGENILHIKEYPDTGGSTTKYEYLHRDHLGSVEVVTDENGNELRVMSFDPFGDRRKEDWSSHLSQAEIDTIIDEIRESTSRGFTGQENLDRTGFVHMNGRIFDPQLGRFLSADPIISRPDLSQRWNRYSYVMNSPLSLVDPSGFTEDEPGGNLTLPGGVFVGIGSDDIALVQKWLRPQHNEEDLAYYFAMREVLRPGAGQSNSGQADRVVPLSSQIDANLRNSDGGQTDGPIDPSIAAEPEGGAFSIAQDFLKGANIGLVAIGFNEGNLPGIWRGENGKWNWKNWGGNGSTGARSTVTFNTRHLMAIGKSIVFLDVGFEAAELYTAVQSGDGFGTLDSLVDGGAIAVGLAGGPWGTYGAFWYGITDATFGPALSGVLAGGACKIDPNCF